MSNYCKKCFERQEKIDRLEQDFKKEQNRRIELEDYFMKLEQENKELKEKIKDLESITGIFSVRLMEKYKQALKEIREIAIYMADNLDDFETCYNAKEKLFATINEVLK